MVPLVTESTTPRETLNAYVTMYLREEVQAEGLVRNVGAFSLFLEAISFSHGCVLNIAATARNSNNAYNHDRPHPYDPFPC